MPYANNDGVRLAYEREGPGNAETVVFVEGLGYGRWMWRWQHRAVSDDYESIRWDNRGTGESDEPDGPYTVPEMASDLEAVLDHAGVESAHVVGASMGGMIAQQYALEYDRARSLTLMCTSPGGPEEAPIPEETLERMFGVPEDADEREAIRYKMRPAMTEGFWADNQELIDRIVEWRLDSDASEQARTWQAAGVEAFDVHDRLGEITQPTLLVHGTADRVVPYENGELLAAGLPDVEFVTLEGAPHLLFIERRERVTDRLLEFLDDV
ncbi:alpha/beta fold hydrolase [Haloarcula montana]|uniref:alpha/beta fold hydrolase n=1 Tax=Haloarcula montana TaxID=3111776 RepID=UPI002D79994F|nr:alpha/beta fold hydrolase [Haloarcula sp. GH36]